MWSATPNFKWSLLTEGNIEPVKHIALKYFLSCQEIQCCQGQLHHYAWPSHFCWVDFIVIGAWGSSWGLPSHLPDWRLQDEDGTTCWLQVTRFVPASQLDIELFVICRPRRMEIFLNPPRPASSSAVWQQACGGNFSPWLLAMWEFAQYSLETNLHAFDVCQWCGANQIVFVFASCEQQWGDGYLHWDTRNYGLFPLQDLWMYAIYSCQEGKRVTKRLRLSTNFASFHPRVHLENGSLRWRVQSFAGSVKSTGHPSLWWWLERKQDFGLFLDSASEFVIHEQPGTLSWTWQSDMMRASDVGTLTPVFRKV